MAGIFRQRMSRGAMSTAVAAAAMAALTGSTAPGTAAAAAKATSPPASTVSGSTRYYTDLPPLSPIPGKPHTSVDASSSGSRMMGPPLPTTVFDAYTKAEASLAQSDPGCNLPWQLLAAIGQVESGQAWGGRVTADGTTRSPILGPELDGNGFAAIKDTDGGRYDGDSRYDRAVGPMQFIPSTWATWGADGNGDGRADPDNVYDAALAAGRYLCAGGRDLSRPQDVDRAILGYNHSAPYLRIVKAWFAYFRTGHYEVPDSTESGPYPSPDSSRGSSAPSPSPSESTRPKPSRPSSPQPTPSSTPSGSGGGGDTGNDAPSPGTPSKPPGADRSPIRVPGLKTLTDTVAGLVARTHESCTSSKVLCAR